MSGLTIGIIGGTGGIGAWFAAFFRQAGHTVEAVGRHSGMSLPELARTCPVVIVAVPIAATAEVIRGVGPLLPAESLLMDFTSLKASPVREMLAHSRAEVIGCHPLFGPNCPSLAGQNIVLCPARGELWLGCIQRLFADGGARVTVTTPDEHDRMMALVQGATHLDSILMGLSLRDSGTAPETLAAFSTPIFRTKQAIVERVFEAPELYAGILTGNPALPEILGRYEKNLARLKELVLDGNAAALAALMKKRP